MAVFGIVLIVCLGLYKILLYAQLGHNVFTTDIKIDRAIYVISFHKRN